MSGKAFIDHFSALEDPRQAWKVLYPLPEILLLVLCATLGGAEDFVEIARWGTKKLDFLRRLLPFERGIASHDTLTDVMTALPVTENREANERRFRHQRSALRFRRVQRDDQGNTAPTAKVGAEPSAAWRGRPVTVSEMPSSSCASEGVAFG